MADGIGNHALAFIILISVVGAVAILFGMSRWRRTRDAGLVRAADRLGGSLADVEGLELPSIRFAVEGRPAVIEFERGEAHLTRVKVSMARRSPGACRIVPQSLAGPRARFLGCPDIRIGDRKFDQDWFIASRPESLARRIFAEERRREVIDSVRRIARFEAPSIEISRDALIVRANGLLLREDDVMALASTAIDFVRYLFHLGPDDGIAWMAGGEADPGLCPVCAASLAEAVVYCDKCKTPQHEECWVYVGQCSTYACKGKRFVA